MSATPLGLAPFDEPVYLEHRDDDPVERAAETRARASRRPVVAFLCRASIVTALGTLTPYLTTDDRQLVLVPLVAVHLALTTVSDLRGGRRSVLPSLGGGATILDLVVVAGFSALLGRHVLAVAVVLLLITFHRWLYGRTAGEVSAVAGTALMAALLATGQVEGDWLDVLVVGLAGALLVWLVDDEATRHHRTFQGLHLVANRAEAVLEGIGDAIVSTDARGRVRGINPAGAELLGSTIDDARGRTCRDVLALQANGRPVDCSASCALLQADARSVEVARTGPRGNRQPLLASAVALRDDSGTPVEIVHLFRDITSLKQAEEAKTLFLATTSHELKTPLAVIRGYAQLLRMVDLDEDARREALESIEVRSGQLVSIVDRLLMSSRIDAGRIDLESHVVPVGEVLRQRAAEFSQTCRSVVVDVADDLPDALADIAALSTIVDHLLENADKYSPKDTVIGLTAIFDDEHVLVRVSDEGIGMSAEGMRHCFDRFWQAEGSDVRRFGGTGIGLYIVRSLAEAMHGEVSVASNVERGVTFTVRLRRQPFVDVTEQPPSSMVTTDGEASIVREFMRQVGVLTDSGVGS